MPSPARSLARRPSALAATLVLAALPACSPSSRDATGTGPSAGSAALLDACLLLTAAEITAAVGRPPGRPERIAGRVAGTCKWPSADGRDPELVHVLVSNARVRSYDEYVSNARHAMGRAFKPSEFEKVEGLGDFAVWSGDRASGALQAFTRGRLLQVTAGTDGARPALDVARALAVLALPRLPPAP